MAPLVSVQRLFCLLGIGDFYNLAYISFTNLYISDWNSALFIILNGTKEEHLDMLDGGIIQRLLEEKWKTFARVMKFTIIKYFVWNSPLLVLSSKLYMVTCIQRPA